MKKTVISKTFAPLSRFFAAFFLAAGLLSAPQVMASPDQKLQQSIGVRETQASALEVEIAKLEKLPRNPIISEQIELKKLGLARLKAGT